MIGGPDLLSFLSCLCLSISCIMTACPLHLCFLSSSQNECLPFCCSLFPEQHSPHLPSTPAPPKISFFPILMLLFSASLNIADAFAPLLQVSFLKLQKSFGRLLTRQSRTLRSKRSALSTTKRTWSNKVCFCSLPRLRYVFFVPV